MSCTSVLCGIDRTGDRIDASSIRFNLLGTVISTGVFSVCVGYFSFAAALRGIIAFPSAGVMALVSGGSIMWFAHTVYNIREYSLRIDARNK